MRREAPPAEHADFLVGDDREEPQPLVALAARGDGEDLQRLGLAGIDEDLNLDDLRLRRDYLHFTDVYLMELPPDAVLLHVVIHC